MSALTLKDLTLTTPPKIVPDFVDELVQPDKLAQLRALYMPAIEADAAQFDQLVPAERASTIRKIFALIKPYDPQTYELLKPFRTQLGLIKDEEEFAYFVGTRAGSWKRFEQIQRSCEAFRKLTADDLSAKACGNEASRQSMLADLRTITRLNTFISLTKALAYDAVTLMVPYLDALRTQNHTVLAQAVADAQLALRLKAFELCYLSARAETKLDDWLEPNDAGIACRDELDVYVWLSAALLEHSATPTPGFSAVAGANPLAIFKVKS